MHLPYFKVPFLVLLPHWVTWGKWIGTIITVNNEWQLLLALLPGLHTQLLSLTVWKVGWGRPGRIYHMMRAAADVMLSLLTSGLVLSPSLFFPWIQFILSIQFVLWVWLLLDWSWLAAVRDVSSGTHHMINPSRPSPHFCIIWVYSQGLSAPIVVFQFSQTFLMWPATAFETSGPKSGFSCAKKAINQLW